MKNLANRIKNFAPDVAKTIQRFPLPTLFLAIGTALLITITNDFLIGEDDFWLIMALGFMTAALYATAGRLFAESRGSNLISIILLEIIIPMAVIAAMQIKSFTLLFPFFLPLIGIFWLSVAPFTKIGKGEERQEIQDRFWIMNHRAVASAIIAGFGFAIIALGMISIERAFALLFGIDISGIFYEYLLPFAGLFLVPFYWLSTIEDLDKLSAKELDNPDFISKAIGFLGQFLFVPFLLAYALILLVYAGQIVVFQTMPVGTLGWMVLGFTITGAVAWLLVYPSFMTQKIMVRLFRKTWFWLTIVPLVLFVIGVYIRINVYGLTPERMLLVAGGVWALFLTILFLSKKFADIRLMPALAGIIFIILSIGPFNIIYAPILNQASRLETALESANKDEQEAFLWEDENANKAIGAIDYLYREDDAQELLQNIFASYNLGYEEEYSKSEIYKLVNLDNFKSELTEETHRSFRSVKGKYFDLTATPYYLGKITIIQFDSMAKSREEKSTDPIYFEISDQTLNISNDQRQKTTYELSVWLEKQQERELTNPEIYFKLGEKEYRLLVISITQTRKQQNKWQTNRFEALLFSSEMPKD